MVWNSCELVTGQTIVRLWLWACGPACGGLTARNKGICLLWCSERLSQEASGCSGKRRVLIPALLSSFRTYLHTTLSQITHTCASRGMGAWWGNYERSHTNLPLTSTEVQTATLMLDSVVFLSRHNSHLGIDLCT